MGIRDFRNVGLNYIGIQLTGDFVARCKEKYGVHSPGYPHFAGISDVADYITTKSSVPNVMDATIMMRYMLRYIPMDDQQVIAIIRKFDDRSSRLTADLRKSREICHNQLDLKTRNVANCIKYYIQIHDKIFVFAMYSRTEIPSILCVSFLTVSVDFPI